MLANRDRTANTRACTKLAARTRQGRLKRERKKQKTAIFACLGLFSVFGVFVAWSRRKKERRRDTHRTLEREELSKQKDSRVYEGHVLPAWSVVLVTD